MSEMLGGSTRDLDEAIEEALKPVKDAILKATTVFVAADLQAAIQKGMFWYLESDDNDELVVRVETKDSCPVIFDDQFATLYELISLDWLEEDGTTRRGPDIGRINAVLPGLEKLVAKLKAIVDA